MEMSASVVKRISRQASNLLLGVRIPPEALYITMEIIFYLIVLIFSVIIHEVSHGIVADQLGDPTARYAGRLTLNPLSHLDVMGSLIVPILFYFTTGIAFGWAKPVPYNPHNLPDPKTGGAIIAFAGPLANLALAFIFAFLLKFVGATGLSGLSVLFQTIIYTNVALAVFNLVPIPPLDGSKVLFAFLPPGRTGFAIEDFLNRYGMIILLIFIFFGYSIISPIIYGIARFLIRL